MRAIVLDLVHAIVLKLRLLPNDVGASAAESGAAALSVDFGGSAGPVAGRLALLPTQRQRLPVLCEATHASAPLRRWCG